MAELDISDVDTAAPPALDLPDLKTFLMTQPTKGAPLTECTIERHKSLFATRAYELRVDQNNTVVACTRKALQQKHASYKIASGASLRKEQMEVVGKLRSNGMTNGAYVLFGPGANMKKVSMWDDDYDDARENARKQIGTMRYTRSVRQKRPLGLSQYGPREIEFNIVDAEGREYGLSNKQPEWDANEKKHILRGYGHRAGMDSTKNFILELEGEGIVFRMCKRGKNEFSMDYTWPLNALQAFAISLTAFDHHA